MFEKIVFGLGGAVIGFISGLLPPWVKWEIEKRQKRCEYRTALITIWREAIETFPSFDDEPSRFGDTEAYSSLRPHLRREIIDKFEAPRTLYVGGGRGESVRKQMLLDEVARLEKKWGLI